MSRPRSTHRCTVCDKAIAKRLTVMFFNLINDSQNPNRTDGERSLNYIFLRNPPRTKEEAQRYSNHPIVGAKTYYNGYISTATYWDGESYQDKYFCSNTCAIKQGYASAQHGARFTWPK